MALHGFKGLILTSLSLEGSKTDDVGRDLNGCQAQLFPQPFADKNTEAGGLTVCQ